MERPPRHNDQLAVKKIGKKIKKTPPTLPNAYTSKNRSRRSIVPPMPQPTHNLSTPPMMMVHDADQVWSNITAQSPASVSLQSSSGEDSGSHVNQTQQSHLPLTYNKSLPSARFSGILPTPVSVCIPSPQSSFGPNRNQMKPSHDYQQPTRFNGPGILSTPPGVSPRSFTSSSMAAQGGILGPGKFPRPPHPSTGLLFPPSPFGENNN